MIPRQASVRFGEGREEIRPTPPRQGAGARPAGLENRARSLLVG